LKAIWFLTISQVCSACEVALELRLPIGAIQIDPLIERGYDFFAAADLP